MAQGSSQVNVSSDPQMVHVNYFNRMNAFDWLLSNSLQDPEKPGGDMKISNYFAITGPALMADLEIHSEIHP